MSIRCYCCCLHQLYSAVVDVELGPLENEGKNQKERLCKENEGNDMEVEHTDEMYV